MMLRWMAALAVAALALVSGCGGGADRTKALVRLVNASTGYSQLEMRVDDQLRQGGVAYGGSAGYAETDPGKPFTVTSPSSPTALLSFTPSVSAKKYYSLLAYGRAGGLKQVMLDDNNAQPDTNRTFVRVVNAAPDAGALDVYITASTDALDSAVPVQAAAAVDSVGAYFTVTSGSWRLRATAPGGKAASDVRLDVDGLSLGSKEVVTVVLVPGTGGVLVKALVLRQQAGIDVKAAAQARVRVATGLTGVSVTLGGSTLLAAPQLPVVTAYAVVTAGSPSLAVTIGSASVATTPPTLDGGADYTLIVHGTASAPLLAWVTDNNAPPTDTTKAKLRLANGTSGVASALSMTVDGAPLPETVVAGAASNYVPQQPTTTAGIEVASSGGSLCSATDRVFTAGSIYSVFALGAAGSTTCVFRQDR